MKKMMTVLVVVGIALAGIKYDNIKSNNGRSFGDVPPALPVLPIG